jgi:hypothetical protein
MTAQKVENFINKKKELGIIVVQLVNKGICVSDVILSFIVQSVPDTFILNLCLAE